MPSPNHSIVFWAPPVGASTAIAVGNVLIPDEDDASSWVVATTAARDGRRSEGIAVSATSGSGFGSVEIIQAGTIDATISGLAAGSASWVRCSSTGTIERCTPSGSDDIIGYAEADGRVHLCFGVLTADIINGGGATPGGSTGSVQGNDGAGGLTGYSTVLVGSGFISIGTTPATAGALRLANAEAIYALSTTATDVQLLRLSSGNVVQVGDASHDVAINVGTSKTLTASADTHRLLSGSAANEFLNVNSTRALFTVVPHIYDSDLTHAYQFAVSNLSANRTVTLPLLTGDDTFVFAAHTQTLTNKTFDVAGTGNVLTSTSAAQYDMLVANASGHFKRQAKGANSSAWLMTSGGVANWSFIVDANIDPTAGIAGTKISPDFGSQNIKTTGVVSIGATPATTGSLRLTKTDTIKIRDGTNAADVFVYQYDGGGIQTFGDTTGTAYTTYVYGGNYAYVGTPGGVGTYFIANTSGSECSATVANSVIARFQSAGVALAKPLGGSQFDSVPFRWKSAAITQSSTADTTLSAAQYECPVIAVTGTPGGNFNVIPPNTADAYFAAMSNGTANTMTVKKSGGTGFAIATNKTASARHNGTDYVRVTPDA